MDRVEGDLIELALKDSFDVIVHGCNCFHTMGAGIAKPIAHTFPEALAADRATSKGDRSKLGEISFAEVERDGQRLTIVNAYTQFQWKGRGRKVDYDALRQCFRKIAEQFGGQRIGYPMIGAGLAGGDWNVIETIIDEEMLDQTHTLVVLPN